MTPQDLPDLDHFACGLDLRLDLAGLAADLSRVGETPPAVRRFVQRSLAAARDAGGQRAA